VLKIPKLNVFVCLSKNEEFDYKVFLTP
jgi:hypothetical protein